MTSPVLLHKALGRGTTRRGVLYGIEVEAEGLDWVEHDRLRVGEQLGHPTLQSLHPTWGIKTDGSLRNHGVEFVSKPLKDGQVPTALEQLTAVFQEGIVHSHVRAGTHIHVNFGDRPKEALGRFLQSYLLVEPLLFEVCGRDRMHNIYCVPVHKADNETRLWRRVLADLSSDSLGAAGVRVRGACKYSALNIVPLVQFGTVEFRHAPCLTDLSEMLLWWRAVRWAQGLQLDLEDDDVYRTIRVGFEEHVLRSKRRNGEGVDWDWYMEYCAEWGIRDIARGLQPCTYKAPSWGKPASMAFGASNWKKIRSAEMPTPAEVVASNLRYDGYDFMAEGTGREERVAEPETFAVDEDDEEYGRPTLENVRRGFTVDGLPVLATAPPPPSFSELLADAVAIDSAIRPVRVNVPAPRRNRR